MRESLLPILLACVAVAAPDARAEGLPALTCHLDRLCIAGTPCEAASEGFSLMPDGDAYRVGIDAGEVRLTAVSPPDAQVRTFLLSGPASVNVLLSLYPDGAMALTTQEMIDGPHVETGFGRCRPETP